MCTSMLTLIMIIFTVVAIAIIAVIVVITCPCPCFALWQQTGTFMKYMTAYSHLVFAHDLPLQSLNC